MGAVTLEKCLELKEVSTVSPQRDVLDLFSLSVEDYIAYMVIGCV